jgi:hypothetical protein
MGKKEIMIYFEVLFTPTAEGTRGLGDEIRICDIPNSRIPKFYTEYKKKYIPNR